MRSLLFVFMFCMIASAGPARADLTIFDMRKNLPLSDAEPVYRDFYISGGSESGLSVGMVLTVQRRLPLYDTYQNRSAGDLQLKVAKIKIIHVQRGLSVARLHSEFTRDSAPILEDNFVMVGDRIDLNSASSGSSSGSGGGGGSAAAPAPAPTEEPAAQAAPPAPKPVAQVRVNATDLSSQEAPARAANAPSAAVPTPKKGEVEAPILQ